MVAPVRTLSHDANGAEVSDLMRRFSIRHIPIVDDADAVLGLVTHRDMLAKAFGAGQDLPQSIRRPYLQSIPVSEIMTARVETAGPETDLRSAACAMLARRHGCLVVTEEGRLVGILTSSDFVRYVAGCDDLEAP